MEYIRCPLCGKNDIEYGVSVCNGCQAEIRYGSKAQGIKVIGVGALIALFAVFMLAGDAGIWGLMVLGVAAFVVYGGICLWRDQRVHFERRKFR